MLLVVTNTYVDENHPYENAFVHSRLLSYVRDNIQAEVFVVNNQRKARKYEFEGIKVQVGSTDDFFKRIESEEDIRLCFHFISDSMIKALEKIKVPKKLVVFVHGVEALKWYERLFPGIISSYKMFFGFLKYIIANTVALKKCRRFFSTTIHECEFVAVSEWMKNIAEKNWNCKGKFKWHIIPNYINEERFPYVEKKADDVKHLLSIRQFSTGKYANDLTVDLILKLEDEIEKDKIKFTFVGDGRLYDKTMAPVINNAHLILERRLLPQSEIPLYHKNNGLFICPTRQDAQGVSMCEAMASGLVPVTLYNTAIPEYLPDDERLYCYSVEDMRDLVLHLINNPEEFMELSEKCSEFIRDKCSEENTTKKELKLMSE